MPDDPESATSESGFGRRTFLRLTAAAAATPAIAALASESAHGAEHATAGGTDQPTAAVAPSVSLAALVEEQSISELQASMRSGRLSSLSLVEVYLQRIRFLDQRGPTVNSVIEVNPDARAIAQALDRERRAGHVRGPLHGIPILLKDNIDTADKTQTAAGSLALVGRPAPRDATVAHRLRAAGAVILGKAGLSEWANFRSTHSSSGWSGRGGQVHNPYALDRNPCGSSSGSAAAVSANFVTAALATETDGSIVCPAHQNGVVGIKPTVGLTSRAGVVPISHSQDTVGPHGRTVADAATVLGALVGVDPRDPATAASAGHFHRDYRPFLDPHGLRGARIGVARSGVTGFSEKTDAIFEQAIAAIRRAGATVVDPADIPTIDTINGGVDETTVLIFEFKRDLRTYLQGRPGVPIRNLADAIAFNRAHAFAELRWFGQELFELAQSDPFTQAQYLASLANERRLGGRDGIDAVLRRHNLDALVAPTGAPAWTTDLIDGDHFLGGSSSASAIAGYPIVQVPMGNSFGLPVGISFMGTAWSEPMLIRLASGFEAATHARRKPQFHPKLGAGAEPAGGLQFTAPAGSGARPSKVPAGLRNL